MLLRKRRSRTSRAKRGLVVIFAAAALAAGIGEISASTVADGSASPNVTGVYTGALSPQSTSSFGLAVGLQPAFAMDFLDGTSWSTLVNGAPTYMSTWSGTGYEMVWSVPMLPNSFTPDSNVADTSGSAYGLQQGAAGAYDSNFLKLAQEMVAGGQGSSIIRPGWEFNGNWFPWAAKGQAAAFVGYWQQIVTTMRSVPGQNFRFAWNPTAGDEGVGNLADFYPGSAYVDYIGVDLYDQAWANYTGISSEWNTYLTEPYGLNWLASFAASQGKAITLPEWGLDPDPSSNNGGPTAQSNSEVGGGDDPAFINDMAQWIRQNNVVDASYWDYESSRLSTSSNPESFAAFVSDFGPGATTGPVDTTTTTQPPSDTTTTDPADTTTTTTTTTTTDPVDTTTTDPADTTTTTQSPSDTTTTTGPVDTTTTGPVDTTTTSPADTTTPSSSGDAATTGTAGGSGGSGSQATGHSRQHFTPSTGGRATSTVWISRSSSRVFSSKLVQYSALVRALPSQKVGPAGPVMWTVTSRYGTPVSCPAVNSGRDPENGRTSCTVPPGQLSAGAGPYTVAVHYAGGGNVAPSMSTLVQRVARAGSTTEVVVNPTLLPGNLVQIAAMVGGRPSALETPTGIVTFSVREKGKQPITCQAGVTATLVSGVAACSFVADSSPHSHYFVKITYHGDGDFGSATAKRIVTVRSESVSLHP